MKKTLARIIALALVIACVFTIVACAKPELDIAEAKANLEAKDYFVSTGDGEGMFVNNPAIVEYLTATNGDENLTIVKFETSKAAKLYLQSLELQVENKIEELELEIKLAKYMLKKFDDKLSSDEIDDYNDEIKDCEEEIDELEEQLDNMGRSGKSVWTGTEDAIKASK